MPGRGRGDAGFTDGAEQALRDRIHADEHGRPLRDRRVPVFLSLCKVVMLPLAPQQLHYLVVYHNMDHANGGLAIKETFNRFAEQNFPASPAATACSSIAIPIEAAGADRIPTQ